MRPRRLLALLPALALTAPAAAQAETITYTGAGEKRFVVPAGVTSLLVDAVGGSGGSGACQPVPNGGFGARLSTTLRVTPGTPLIAFVAANGGAGRGDNLNAVASLLGGGGAGGASGATACGGGAGGDATAIGLVSNLPALGIGQTPEWLASRLIVAGGGGGGGGGGPAGGGGVGGEAGGASGDGGQGLIVTGAGGFSHGGFGGGAGTATAGGAGGPGGYAASGSGTFGQAGFGASWPPNQPAGGAAGGGGGGGLFGGGGGGTPNVAAGAGGGGAGSSFVRLEVTSGTTLATDSTRVPSITFTWGGPGGTPAPPGAGSTPGGQTGGTTVVTAKGRVVLNTFIDKRPRTVVRTRRDRTTVSFSFSSNVKVKGVRFRCKLDQRQSSPCSSGKRYTVSRGIHRFRVWAVVDGKSDSTPASFSFTVARKR